MVFRLIQAGTRMPTTLVVLAVTVLLLQAVTARIDYCKLPAETGSCQVYSGKYYYNAGRRECHLFKYGGCNGNGNRFNSSDECLRACHKTWNCNPENGTYFPNSRNKLCQSKGFYEFYTSFTKSIYLGLDKFETICKQYIKDTCVLPPLRGPCLGNCSKFYYNANTETCEEFIYGGCGGNENRFETQQECGKACNGTKAPNQTFDSCLLSPEHGPCYGYFNKYYYNSTSLKCENFRYGGCEGNGNRFNTIQKCNETCDGTSSSQPSLDICLLPSKTGPCRASFPNFFYNSTSKTCENFFYGGCQGNENRFETRQECEVRCKDASINICLLPKETGPCEAIFRKFYYNASTEKCENFIYGGCKGNYNRFETQQECENVCNGTSTPQPHVDICLLPSKTGPCRASFSKFFYNSTSKTCENFIYGGCQGNENRFETRQECEKKCSNAPSTQSPVDTCLQPSKTGRCKAFFRKFYYNASTEICEEFIYGGCQGNDNRFETQQECEKTCNGTVIPIPAKYNCLLPPDTGPCKGSFQRFFYSPTSKLCEPFIYGGCQGNGNRFLTIDDCCLNCQYSLSDNVCRLPPDMGPCDDNLQKYFYNKTAHACQLFTYGGCGGNNNRFDSRLDCQQKCKCSTL